MIGASPFAKVILSEAKDLGVRTVEILATLRMTISGDYRLC